MAYLHLLKAATVAFTAYNAIKLFIPSSSRSVNWPNQLAHAYKSINVCMTVFNSYMNMARLTSICGRNQAFLAALSSAGICSYHVAKIRKKCLAITCLVEIGIIARVSLQNKAL